MNKSTKYALYALWWLFILWWILNTVEPEVKDNNAIGTWSEIEYTWSNITWTTEEFYESTWIIKSTWYKDDKKPECFSVWDWSVRSVEKFIKENMNDPDSYKHVSTKSIDDPFSDNRIIITEYRGKNAYGWVVKDSAVIWIDEYCNISKLYTEKELDKIIKKLNNQ